MKLAFTVATPEVTGRTLAWTGPVDAIARALADLGFAGAELFVRDPAQFDAEAVARALADNGLSVAAVGTGPAAVDDRLSFTAPSPEARDAAVRRTCAIVDFAERFGAQVNIGKLRGNTQGSPQASAWRDDAFRAVCSHAAQRGVIITLEPQHRGIIDNLNSTKEAIEWIDALALPNLRLMLDSFHMQVEDPDLPGSLLAAGRLLHHIHLSDTLRLPPGLGEIDFPVFLRTLRSLGYDRYLTVEIEQKPDSPTAAALAASHLKGLLKHI